MDWIVNSARHRRPTDPTTRADDAEGEQIGIGVRQFGDVQAGLAVIERPDLVEHFWSSAVMGSTARP